MTTVRSSARFCPKTLAFTLAWPVGIVLFSSAVPCFAQSGGEQPKLAFTAGLRAWVARWDSWTVGQAATGVAVGDGRFEVVESVSGRAEVAAIPVFSMRYGPAFVSASAMTSTKYELKDTATPGGFDVPSSRREADLNLGYTFASGVTSSLGYKQIIQRFGGEQYKWKGPVLGVGANLPLSGPWGAYTSFGLGRLRGTFPGANSDAAGRTRFNADYSLVEVGITHAFSQPLPRVSSVVITLGYRAQRINTKNYTLGFTPTGGQRQPNTRGDLIDATGGFVLGAQAAF